MNNNMPNNMGNGMPNNNPMAQAANEQLMGGQSAAPSAPSVMQGVPGAQNPNGVMQGVNNAVNNPGVMQGIQTPAPQAPVGMPGQTHSGINPLTMQKEESNVEEPGVVNIPNLAANNQSESKIDKVQIPNGVPNMMNNPEPNPINNVMQTPPIPEAAPVQPEVGPAPTMNSALSGALNDNMPSQDNVIGEPINQMPNPMGPAENQAPNVQGPSVVMQTPPTPTQNNVIGNTSGLDNQIGDANIGNNDTAPAAPSTMSTVDNDVAEMSDLPEKKFPLSTREMVLIGIALVGIVAVVIMYWPK